MKELAVCLVLGLGFKTFIHLIIFADKHDSDPPIT